jgi:hypothetical protein
VRFELPGLWIPLISLVSAATSPRLLVGEGSCAVANKSHCSNRAEASISSHTRDVSTTTVLIPVGDEPEMLEWLEEFGLRPHSRALRFPTLGELRTAARSTNPTSMDQRSSHGTWYAFLC